MKIVLVQHVHDRFTPAHCECLAIRSVCTLNWQLQAHQHAANAEDFLSDGLLIPAAEEHAKAAKAFLQCEEKSNDGNVLFSALLHVPVFLHVEPLIADETYTSYALQRTHQSRKRP